MEPITISGIGRMTAAELRSTIDRLTEMISGIHLNDDGTPRDFTEDEAEEGGALMTLLDRASQMLIAREQFDRHPNSVEPGMEQWQDDGHRYVDKRGNHAGWQLRGRAYQVDAESVIRMGGEQLRNQALRMLEACGRHLPAEAQDHIAEGIEARLSPEQPNVDGEYIARRMLITESEAYRSAFQQAMTHAVPLFTEAEVRAVRAYRDLESQHEMRAMGEVTPSAGGFGVPVTLDPSIMLISGAAAAPVFEAARRVPVTSNVWKGVSGAPITFTFQTEGATVGDNSPTLAQPSVTVHMARGFVPYSIEVGQDYPRFAEELGDVLQQGWTDLVATKTIISSGSVEPFGVITKLDATTASEVRITTAGVLDAQQIFRVWNALPERFRARARWLMSVTVESLIRAFGAGPNPSAYFTIDLTQDGITRINGRPVMVTDYAPTYTQGGTGTQNALVVGDFSNYLIAVRQGLSIEPIPHLFDVTNNRPTGQRGFFAWGRWGADVVVTEGLRLLNQT